VSDGEQRRRGRMCYACGEANEHGLHMHFRREGDRSVCDFEPREFQQGFPGRMHGGIVTTLIDEAMGWAVYHAAAWGATARLIVRFRRPIRIDERLRVEAWVVRERGRLIELRSEVRNRAGKLLAEAEGSYMKLDERLAGEMTDLARDASRDDVPASRGER
jgi:uncharacterized protein (TIGR00369 family)